MEPFCKNKAESSPLFSQKNFVVVWQGLKYASLRIRLYAQN